MTCTSDAEIIGSGSFNAHRNKISIAIVWQIETLSEGNPLEREAIEQNTKSSGPCWSCSLWSLESFSLVHKISRALFAAYGG
jgi:hypothetical protein